MTRPKIYFWQPVLTDHVVFTFKAAAASLGIDALCISDHAELGVRRAQGWTPAQNLLPSELLPEKGWEERIGELIFSNPHDIHVFGSPFEKSRINLALKLAIKRRCNVFLLSEPYSPAAVSYFGAKVSLKDRLKSWLRPLLYRWYGVRYASHATGVFAISPLAVEQFRSIGVDPSRLFPFGYFVPSSQNSNIYNEASKSEGAIRLAFVGSLIARKGVATAIDAIRNTENPVELDIYGPGDVSMLDQLPGNIRYVGTISFGQAQAILSQYDALLVPSLHDGWAVVVNEAIHAGIAVIASDATGASSMIETLQCGMRYKAGDTSALTACLNLISADPLLLAKMKKQARTMHSLIEPDIAGRYMADCIRAVQRDLERPACPWY